MGRDREEVGMSLENGKRLAYLTQEEFSRQLGVVWLFIMFSFLATGGVGRDVTITLFFAVSVLARISHHR